MTDSQTTPEWTIIIPFYNERDYIRCAVASAIAQRGPAFRLILVDNQSTDGTVDICRELLAAAPHLDVTYLHESRPGHVFALDCGVAAVTTRFVAFWDADTTYPPDYIEQANRLLADGKHVVAQAIDLYCEPDSFKAWLIRFRLRATQIILGKQCHTGAFGQCFVTEVLRKAGGPLVRSWPYVLHDHEVMQRVFKLGSSTGSVNLWCMPADRRGANDHVRWTLLERILYHVVPFAWKDWFFYSFLAGRFDKRQMMQANLRVRDW